MKLREIASDIEKLRGISNEHGHEHVKDTLDAVEMEFNDKAQNILSLTNDMDFHISAIDTEIKRLQTKKSAIKNRSESLRDYLRDNMERTGIDKISCDLFSITLCKPTKTVAIDDIDSLPDDYVNVETNVKPDKKKILADLKSGVDIPGSRLEDGKSRLLIK